MTRHICTSAAHTCQHFVCLGGRLHQQISIFFTVLTVGLRRVAVKVTVPVAIQTAARLLARGRGGARCTACVVGLTARGWQIVQQRGQGSIALQESGVERAGDGTLAGRDGDSGRSDHSRSVVCRESIDRGTVVIVVAARGLHFRLNVSFPVVFRAMKVHMELVFANSEGKERSVIFRTYAARRR